MFARTASLATRGYHHHHHSFCRYHHSSSSNLYNLHFLFSSHRRPCHPQQHKRIIGPDPPSRSSKSFSATTAVMADASGVTVEGLKEKLAVQLGAQYVEIEDMSGGCGQAFQAIIVSPQFEKKNMLARHRLVNSALKSEIAAIHAWTPRCYTPEQWEKIKEEQS